MSLAFVCRIVWVAVGVTVPLPPLGLGWRSVARGWEDILAVLSVWGRLKVFAVKSEDEIRGQVVGSL